MPLKNCWEIKQCGREQGGARAEELGVCPAYPDRGHSCWMVTGTLCGGKVQGTFAQKEIDCLHCETYKRYNLRSGTQKRELVGECTSEMMLYLEGSNEHSAKQTPEQLLHTLVDAMEQTLEEQVQAQTRELIDANKRLREQEEELRTQNMRFKTAMDNMGEGLCMFDAGKRLVVCNDHYAKMYRLPPELLKAGTPHSAIIAHRVRNGLLSGAQDEDAIAQKLRALGMLPAEVASSRVEQLADGRLICVTRQPMDGGGWVATHEDVTDKVKAENEKEQQKSQLDAALRNMSQGLAMFDSSARLIVCNRRYHEMYGLSPEIVKPGCLFHEIVAYRIKSDNFFTDNVEAFISDLRAKLDSGITVKKFANLRDGRIISIVDHPTVDGGWITTHEDVTELRRAEEQFAYAAQHDALTDLANRTQFHEQLEQALKRVGRGEQLAVLYLDLDNFKVVNDTFGHMIGDELLKSVADRLRACVRDTDTIARLGGDEFAIIQTAVERPADAAYLATRINETIKAPCDIAGHQLTVQVSIGIAIAPGDGVEAEQLLKNADMALYQAKTAGRDMFCFFEAEMDARMKARSALEFELRQAIMGGEFELYYQPLLNLHDGKITTCEALLRWNHPERGMISPAEFIPVAEETGLINQLGEWVLRTACAEAMTWPDDIKVAVNVSPIQFKNQSIALTVVGALAASGLPASRLELEITESALIQDEEATLAKLAQLQELGVRIVMDDFGTGYSSLRYLHLIPFDKIKIDRSFIANITDKDSSLAIVQAVVNIAQSCNIATVAEGVETEQQLELIGMLRCTEMQGYLFSRPVPARDLVKFFPRHPQMVADAANAA